jgi:hypothetical protein
VELAATAAIHIYEYGQPLLQLFYFSFLDNLCSFATARRTNNIALLLKLVESSAKNAAG